MQTLCLNDYISSLLLSWGTRKIRGPENVELLPESRVQDTPPFNSSDALRGLGSVGVASCSATGCRHKRKRETAVDEDVDTSDLGRRRAREKHQRLRYFL